MKFKHKHQTQTAHTLPHAVTHHLASISLAAVYMDVVHIEEGIDGLKQRALALALAPCDSE